MEKNNESCKKRLLFDREKSTKRAGDKRLILQSIQQKLETSEKPQNLGCLKSASFIS